MGQIGSNDVLRRKDWDKIRAKIYRNRVIKEHKLLPEDDILPGNRENYSPYNAEETC